MSQRGVLFKRQLFTVLTLSLGVILAMLAIGSLSWLAGLPEWGNSTYRSWLAIENVLASLAIAILIFHRQPSLHPYERPLPSYRHTSLAGNASRQIGWWSLWLLAYLMFTIPILLQYPNWRWLGIPRAALSLWWLADLCIAGWDLFHDAGRLQTRDPRTPVVHQTLLEKFLRVQRSVLSLAVFLQCTLSTIATNSSPVWLTYLFCLMLVLAALTLRTMYQPFDHRSLFGQSFLFLFRCINRFWVWHELPKWVGIANLAALREELRIYNLHSTAQDQIAVTDPTGLISPVPSLNPNPNTSLIQCPFSGLWRTPEGSFNDPQNPTMGIASQSPPGTPSTEFTQSHPDARFGRNMPFESLDPPPDANPRLLCPNPRIVSCKLLARDPQRPDSTLYAPTINLLAAAWIQFQTHGWFSHGTPRATADAPPFEIDTREDPEHDRWPDSPMRVERTRRDPTRRPQDQQNAPETFVNSESHWWDASQIYGAQTWRTDSLKNQACPYLQTVHTPTPSGDANTGFFDNWWLGLSLLHELFVKEHNAICDALAAQYPNWSSEHRFQKARLINAALMAKIHTIEWTPAILANPMLEKSMNANWFGLFSDRVLDAFGRLGLNEAFWGIPDSGINHHAAPYSLTEEFVAVYRMHSLMPDSITLKSHKNPDKIQRCSLEVGQGAVGQEVELKLWESFCDEEVLYSFGTELPGALSLNNYPNFLRRFRKPVTGELLDLATIDILRDRERQIPRYNRFRTELRMKPIRSFNEFNSPQDQTIAGRLRDVYGTHPDGSDKVDDLDLLVGTLAEAKPEGFGFSDTTFRIFILMASRRLKSDRFTAQDFTPDVYTQLGLDWVNNNSMKDVILRHHPDLAAPMFGTTNAFKPWR